MCGASMGMVFCDAFSNPGGDSTPPAQANGGSGFSLLFKSWVISTKRSYYCALLGVFAMGLLRQWIVSLRVNLVTANAPSRRYPKPALFRANGESVNDLLLSSGAARGAPPRLLRSAAFSQSPWLLLCVECALLFFALGLSYLNMLVAMTYDAGLISALVAGETVAYGSVRAGGLVLGENTETIEADPADCCS
jgi:hypothetical protein